MNPASFVRRSSMTVRAGELRWNWGMSRTTCDSAVHTLTELKVLLSLKDDRVLTSHRSSFRSFASTSRWFVCRL